MVSKDEDDISCPSKELAVAERTVRIRGLVRKFLPENLVFSSIHPGSLLVRDADASLLFPIP